MKGKIFATTGQRRALMDKYGITAASLSKILCFESNSLRARQLRCFAVNYLKCVVWMDEHKFL